MASYEKGISDAAVALKEQLKLTDCWEIAKKWMYRIIGAILLAVPSAMLGLKAGPGGAVAGGAVGGYAGYKFGNRIGNYFSPVRAKSDHANVISAIVHKNISRSK
jgi:phage tail tape-measure protein